VPSLSINKYHYGGLKMTSIAKEDQISNQPNDEEEVIYLTVPVEYLTVPVAYKMRSLLNALEPLAEAADNKALKVLIDAVNKVLYERYHKGYIEYCDGIKKLTNRQMLSEWFEVYCGLVEGTVGFEESFCDVLLASELAERGQGRYTEKLTEAAENIGQELSDCEYREFYDSLSRMTEAELQQEWDFYSEILDLCNWRNVKDRQRRDMLKSELWRRGIMEARSECSVQSCN
jgi:hypothetical protein